MNALLQLIRRTAELPRGVRAALVALIEILICAAAALFAFWLRLGEWHWFDRPVVLFMAIAIPIWLTIALSTRTYRSLVRFSGRETIRQLAIRCGLMSIALAVVLVPLRVPGIPRTLAVLHPLVFMLALAGSRLGLGSLLLQALYSGPLRQKRKRVLIYGAGSAGQQLANSVREDPQIRVIGFVDENRFLSNRTLEDTVFHAAAYKHVPLIEENPLQGVRNNVIGTLNACLTAEATGTGTFILVSTDKAVRPTSVMGASKRGCELIIQARAKAQQALTYSSMRLGNVLGSSGSVVPLFRRQIEKGGPVTVTHADVTRYFMAIPEASQLVIQAGAMAEGGDIFLLDMGDPRAATSSCSTGAIRSESRIWPGR